MIFVLCLFVRGTAFHLEFLPQTLALAVPSSLLLCNRIARKDEHQPIVFTRNFSIDKLFLQKIEAEQDKRVNGSMRCAECLFTSSSGAPRRCAVADTSY